MDSVCFSAWTAHSYQVLSRMDDITLSQLITKVHTILTDEKVSEETVATTSRNQQDCHYRSEEMWGGSARVSHTDKKWMCWQQMESFSEAKEVARVRSVHENPVKVEVFVVESNTDCMLKQLGGVSITEFGDVRFCKPSFCAAINITEPKFGVEFNQYTGIWTASWK